ncbi:MAG: 4-hydroxy-tetrahydrodipicolinate reductase [Pseudomonadota bacterium]
MSSSRITIIGAAGRMGQALIAAVEENPDTVLSAAVERSGSSALGTVAGGTNIEMTDDVTAALAVSDVVVDFTTPQNTVSLAQKAAELGVCHVIGTTGFEASDEEAITGAANKTTIVKSGNMSMGVIMLSVLVEQAARALGGADWDLEVMEMHHRHKVDAPSGTALLLGEAAASGREIDLGANAVRVRDGHTGAREEGSIGFATLRGGSVVGDHSVILAGNGERVTLSHHAEDRSIFARGAIKAAIWAHRKNEPGLYSMRDVLGLNN